MSLTIITIDHYSPGDGLLGWGLTINRAGADPGICDCNGNGTPDDVDISAGTSADANGNSIPDECESLDGDANSDGVVNVEDLVMVFTSWGPCPEPPVACGADVDGNGKVDVNDMLMVVLNWS